jgi:hypothetical protein
MNGWEQILFRPPSAIKNIVKGVGIWRSGGIASSVLNLGTTWR